MTRFKNYCEICAPDECNYQGLCKQEDTNRIIKRKKIKTLLAKLVMPEIMLDEQVELLDQAITQAVEEAKQVDENTSDGYHTFKELYEFRMLYNAGFFNELAKDKKYNVHKSWRHNDGELCFGGGWFIVMADLPTGQISNHYEEKDWELFKCDIAAEADKWDGHTPQDVAKRLRDFLLLDKLTK